MSPDAQNALDPFHPVVRTWFEGRFGTPSPPQSLGWPSIASDQHTLILAPTGSGKTLASFLWAINLLVEERVTGQSRPGVRILYVSPLKALNNDIHRNLEEPLDGIHTEARRADLLFEPIRTAVRTGDTPQSARASMLRNPPDILITTPESLYLLLTSPRARKMFAGVRHVIVDEIHAVCGNKRGVHLSLSLERLAAVAEEEFVRIGLSATQRPLEEIAGFLGGHVWQGRKLVRRPVQIVDAGRKKDMDLRVVCAPADFSTLPQNSVWPLIMDELLALIRAHRTTLIFVNNRRLAERIAARLNEMIVENERPEGERPETEPPSIPRGTGLYSVPRSTDWATETDPELPPVQAYHGSMSRESREQMESDLKAGNVRALVATSSLELGIDIGSIDLVIQVQSPKGVARGLQRVGRSGHLIAATSKGRIYPSHREDLVEAAVIARGMREHAVELTAIPRNCLDVLAQQIVAMVSVEDWDVDELFDLVRQSFCYRELSRKLFQGVLQMLAGRYTQEAFRELRPRVSWDKVNNRLRALPGSNRLAITSGGTISDRGYFGVYLENGKTKVGEVDEEFIHESRVGDTFLLGTSVWRMTGIDASRITVVPAPGEPARMPFWRGEGIGRSFEMGTAVGSFRRELDERLDSSDCLTWLQDAFPIDSRSAWNIQEYFRKQRDVCGQIPHDRLLLVEGFHDEIGDPRIVIHSPFGRSVNGLLGMFLSRRLQEMVRTAPQMLYNDDGILLRCSDMDALPLGLFDGITVEEAEQSVMEEVLSSPLFGGQFRQNAARALLMPKVAPGKRTPLWLQRLRAKDLLQVARQFDDFPIVIETVREVLQDILAFDRFRELLRNIQEGTVRVATVRTEVPSPFAASLLFDFVAVYMYEWDEPQADRLSRYVALNREILAQIVDLDAMKALMKPEAAGAVEDQLQHASSGTRARSPEELHEILLRVGDLTEEEVHTRCTPEAAGSLAVLREDGRAVPVHLAGDVRWIAGEEQSLYEQFERDRNAFLVLRRYLQAHGPVSTSSVAERFGWDEERAAYLLEKLVVSGDIVKGHFLSDTMQWCARQNLERIHRQTIAILRKEIRPASLSTLTRFLIRWQGLEQNARHHGAEGLASCLDRLQAVPLPMEIWERDVLRGRISGFAREMLHDPALAGSFVWTGAGSGRAMVLVRGEGNIFLSSMGDSAVQTLQEPARRILGYLQSHGASFLQDLRGGTRLSLDAMNNGIAELFWKGMITNDVWAELQGMKRLARTADESSMTPLEIVTPHHNPRRVRLMQSARRAIRQVPGWTGRWSLVRVPGVMGEEVSPEEQATRQAVQLLERYGVVAREFHRRENLLPWSLVATALQRMELRGEIRRGYFVEGLSGMQFALPAAVEELRQAGRATDGKGSPPILINACDPANPYGPGIELTHSTTRQQALRISRVPGNYLVIQRGVPILLLEGMGTRIWTLAESMPDILRQSLDLFLQMIKLPQPVRPFRQITVEYCDGRRPLESPLQPLLRSLGFYGDRNQTMRFDGS